MKNNYLKNCACNYLKRPAFIAAFALFAWALYATARAESAANLPSLMENLDRGVVAMRVSTTDTFISWRLLGTELSDTAFNIYRITEDGAPVKLNAAPLTQGTNYTDTAADFTKKNTYIVRALEPDGTELPMPAGGNLTAPRTVTALNTLPAGAPVRPYLRIPLSIPAGGTTPTGEAYTYSPGDCSVGDLDGDGEYEIVVKWDPSNQKDNASDGYTGNVYLDAYKLDGTQLWRIDLGKNIRAGSHYTQFMVYDLDGDGIAEVACKTADGTKDGLGVIIGNAAADYRGTSGRDIGRILTGPEYLTIFNGKTGAAMATENYLPARGSVSAWGDSYGNRVDRFLACVAYLDGQRPSLVMCRGYYARSTLAAWDWRDGRLTQRWLFDSEDGTPGNSAYSGQGNHQLSVADVDNDGFDEIIYGACTIDHNGKGLYSTGLRHGDALHVAQMNPAKRDLLVWACHEEISKNGGIGHTLRDAKTGAILFSLPTSSDTDGVMAADIDPRSPGYEIWGARSNIRSSITFQEIVPIKPSMTFGVWWDGDLLREINSGGRVYKWNWITNTMDTILTPEGVPLGNSTKPRLSGDIFGDWREEIILAETDNSALRIYIPTAPTEHRITTLMHDRQYREAIAWQNVAYNQTPHPSFYIGHDMQPPPEPNIVTSLDELLGPPAPVITSIAPDTGISTTDFITKIPNLTLRGTAEPGVTVNVTLVGTGITRATMADFAGNWTLDLTDVTLPEGRSRFVTTATSVDNRTGARSQPRTVIVMITPPPAPAIMGITGDGATCTFTGTAQSGCLVTISVTTLGDLATVEADASGIWTFTCPSASLPAGSYTVTAIAVDEAGNDAVAPSANVLIDTTIATPAITGIANDTGVSNTDGITSDKYVILRGTATAGDTVTVSILGSSNVIGATTTDASGAWSIACGGASGLADGQYAFTATATRGATGMSFGAPAYIVTVDTAAPVVTSITRPSTGTGSAVVFRISFDEAIRGASAASFTPAFTGAVTGAITDVTVVDDAFVDVTVGNLNGDGTVRLDVNVASSGITDIAGNALAAGGVTSSETVTRLRYGDGAWINETPAGLWSNADNWLEGTLAQGVGKTADFSTVNLAQDTTAVIDASGTVGNILFSDTDPSTSGGWQFVSPSSGSAPALRLAVASGGTPEINVSGLALDSQVTIAVPLAGTQGVKKTGGSLLVLSGSSTLTGALTVGTGDLNIGEGGWFNIGNNAISVGASTHLNITGGYLQTAGLVSLGAASGLVVEAGHANLASLRSSSSDLGYVLVTGGTLTVGNVNFRRNSGGADFSTGFIVRAGVVESGTIALGTTDSYGTMSVEGGDVRVTGPLTIGNQTTPGRGGAIRVTGGKLVSTETAIGLVLAKTNGSNANNVATALFSGGEATFEKIALGYDSTVTSGSATITVDGGALYLGSGGIVKNGASGLASKITLASGTLGAKAAWTTTHPLALTSDITICTDYDITFAGAISGAGGFTKTGAGTLTLSGTNNFTGVATINEGTLAVTGTFAKFVKLTWDSAAAVQLDIAHGDRLVVTGTLSKTGATARQIVLTNVGALTAGATLTLGTINATTLVSTDFAPIALGGELQGNVSVSGKTLILTVVGAPPATAPIFTSPTSDTARAGADFNYAVTLENGAATYTISGLPPGLSFNTATGVISGKPTASGTYTITLRATNARGTTDFTLTLAVAPASDTDTHTALVTLAGSAKTFGVANGQTSLARFNSPAALLAHTNGNLYIVDTGNNTIRLIDPPGIVSTLATTGATLSAPGAIIAGGNGSTLLIADTNNNTIRTLDLATAQFTIFATGINRPAGLARDSAGNLYVSTADNAVLKFAVGATTSTTLASGFNNPTALAIDPDGHLYVADTGNHAIRKIDLITSGSIGAVFTIAGELGVSGTANGDALDARFNHPKGLAIDAAGNLYIADADNHAIRHLDTFTNQVTSRSGLIGTSGTADGLGETARLASPTGITIDDATGDIYVADTGNHTIRVLLDSPRILKHPENKNVTAGDPVSFSVLAIGAPNPTYQWKRNGTTIASATNYTYTIATSQTSHAGSYTVLVSNDMGSVTSNSATLTVTATSSSTNSGTTTPPPDGGNTGGGGGGGGALGMWYFLAIALIVFVRARRS